MRVMWTMNVILLKNFPVKEIKCKLGVVSSKMK